MVATRRQDSIDDHEELKEVYAPELPQQLDGHHVHTSGNHTHEGNDSDRCAKYEQHAGGERVVRLIEDTIADSRATSDDAGKTEQSNAAGSNELVRESNDPMAKSEWGSQLSTLNLSGTGRLRGTMVLKRRLTAWTTLQQTSSELAAWQDSW